jgi:hypothetical protein
MEQLDLGGDLSYNKKPIKILDMAERVTRSKVIVQGAVESPHQRRRYLGA